MPLKRTKLRPDEKIILEREDKTSWLLRKGGIVSETASIGIRRDFPRNKFASTNYGTIVLTNQRIIFESGKGHPTESHWHQEIVETRGKNGGIMAGVGEFVIIKKGGEEVSFVMYCGRDFSDDLNHRVYSPEIVAQREISLAQELEKHLDYVGAIEIYDKLGMPKGAARIRRKMYDEKKVDQTIVHGDYVDDRDTIIKDSVVSKSNVGAGGKSKSEELRDAKALLDDGIIDDNEFKQMKKEILGK